MKEDKKYLKITFEVLQVAFLTMKLFFDLKDAFEVLQMAFSTVKSFFTSRMLLRS